MDIDMKDRIEKLAKQMEKKIDKEVRGRLVRHKLVILLLHGKIRSPEKIMEIVNSEMKVRSRL
jgi:hypothetical protein